MNSDALRKNHKKERVILSTVSGVLTTKPSIISFIDKTVPSLDIITTKSYQIKANKGNREPIICSPKRGCFGNSVGLRNPGMENDIEEIKRIKRNMRALLNISLSASTPGDFIRLIEIAEEAADIIELNFSCPHAASGYGSSIGKSEETAGEYTREIVKNTAGRKSLLIIKLTPNVKNIGSIAERVIDEGADGVALINTLGPYLYKMRRGGLPILNNPPEYRGGASGEWVKETALKMIKEVREAIGDEPIILGMGGVKTADDVRRMKEAGADSVGIGSALSFVDPKNFELYFKNLKNNSDIGPLISNNNVMKYKEVRITEKKERGDLAVITVDKKIKSAAGEFIFLYLPLVGEKPFSLCSVNPSKFFIRNRGFFTSHVLSLNPGDTLYYRGPYGKRVEFEKTKKAIILAAGTGTALISLLAEDLKNDGVSIEMRVGIREEGEDLLKENLLKYGKYRAVADRGKIGRVLDTLNEKDFAPDTSLFVIGPEIFMMKAAEKAHKLGLGANKIYLSLEKNTMCGVGMCGECFAFGSFCCREGTFLSYEKILKGGNFND